MDTGTAKSLGVGNGFVKIFLLSKFFEFFEVVPEFLAVIVLGNRSMGKFMQKHVHQFIGTAIDTETNLRTLVCIETQKPSLHSVISHQQNGFFQLAELVVLWKF